MLEKKKKFAPLNRGIIFDKVNPKDFMTIPFAYCCEQCSYFIPEGEACNMGHKTSFHLKRNQLKHYEQSGRMCFCRNQEID